MHHTYYRTSDGKPNGGTGFIGCISNGAPVLFTNNHVIPTVKCAEKAYFTFGFRGEDNKGTKVAGDELLDTKQWQTNQSFMENLVCKRTKLCLHCTLIFSSYSCVVC